MNEAAAACSCKSSLQILFDGLFELPDVRLEVIIHVFVYDLKIHMFGCCDRSPNFHRWPAVLRHLQLFDCLQVSSLPIHKHLRHTCQKNNRTRKHHSTTMESIEEMVWNRNNCKGMMWMLWTLTVCVIFTPSSWSLTLYWRHYVY